MEKFWIDLRFTQTDPQTTCSAKPADIRFSDKRLSTNVPTAAIYDVPLSKLVS